MSVAVVGRDGRELDRIRLLGLRATGRHGVLPEERRDGQTFVADVVLHLDTRPAAGADALALTADYGVVAAQVVAVLAGPPVDLVETLAQRVADVALRQGGVEAVDVVIHKPQAPITVPFTDVLIEVRRWREDLPAAPAPSVAAAPAPEPPAPEAPAPEPPAPTAEAASTAEAVEPLPEPAEPAEPGPAAEPEPEAVGPAPDADAEPAAAEEAADPLGVRPPVEVRAVLALGGNVGDVRTVLAEALTELARTPGIRLVAVSPLARTAAVGPEQDDYLNAVAVVRTSLSPRELLAATSAVEDAHGRVRQERWGPRTLDVDVIVFDSLLSDDPVLQLPHPRARDRAFVLVPWSHVEPGAVLPGLGGGAVTALAETAPDKAGIRWLALDWFDVAAALPAAVQAPDEPAAEDPGSDEPGAHEPAAAQETGQQR